MCRLSYFFVGYGTPGRGLFCWYTFCVSFSIVVLVVFFAGVGRTHMYVPFLGCFYMETSNISHLEGLSLYWSQMK